MKLEIATLTNTVRNISDTTHILTNTVHSLTNTVYNLTDAVYNLTTINQAQEEKIKALEAGSSDIPAFMATLSRDLSDCSTDQFVVFDNAILNIGNVYDEVHGVFRAPVAGTYQFSLSLSVPGDGNQYSVVIKKGTPSTNVGYLYSNSYLNPYYLGRSTSILTQLEEGEDVWVACSLDGTHIAGGTGTIGQFYSHFSGFIVSV
ncbi:hypothetical protein ACJMK2_010417 [Sinanodonta woodiana]|uniref:C1q domain-containing protein n=1 Tax=Sinanodonta woodiana TaxID=1069815 RepID=A0ABD3VFA6_SINWO